MRFSFLSRITLAISLLFISSCLTLEYLKNNIKETYASLATLQTKSIITKVVNKVILESVSLQEVSLNYSSEEYVSYDVNQINLLISSLSSNILYALEHINEGDYQDIVSSEYLDKYNCSGIVYELEFGKLFNNFLVSSLGSKYPIKFKLTSDLLSTCDLEVEEFGINNALVKLNLHLIFSFMMVLPLSEKVDDMDLKVPLSILLIEGEVPSFLYGNHSIEGVNSYVTEVEELWKISSMIDMAII